MAEVKVLKAQQDSIKENFFKELGFSWSEEDTVYNIKNLVEKTLYKGYLKDDVFYTSSDFSKVISIPFGSLAYDIPSKTLYLYEDSFKKLEGEEVKPSETKEKTVTANHFQEKTGSLIGKITGYQDTSGTKSCIFPLTGGLNSLRGYQGLDYSKSVTREEYKNSKYYNPPVYNVESNFSLRLPSLESGVKPCNPTQNILVFNENQESWKDNFFYYEGPEEKSCTNIKTFEEFGLLTSPYNTDDATVVDVSTSVGIERDCEIAYVKNFNISEEGPYTIAFLGRVKATSPKKKSIISIILKNLENSEKIFSEEKTLDFKWRLFEEPQYLEKGSYKLIISWQSGDRRDNRKSIDSMRLSCLSIEKGLGSFYNSEIRHTNAKETLKKYPILIDLRKLEQEGSISSDRQISLRDPWVLSYRRYFKDFYNNHLNKLGSFNWGLTLNCNLSKDSGLSIQNLKLVLKDTLDSTKEQELELSYEDALDFFFDKDFSKPRKLYEFLVFTGEDLHYYIFNDQVIKKGSSFTYNYKNLKIEKINSSNFYETVKLPNAGSEKEDLAFNLLLGGSDLEQLSGDFYSDLTLDQTRIATAPKKIVSILANRILYLQKLENTEEIALKASKLEECLEEEV